MDKSLKANCIGEFLGTALLIFFGVGCVAALKVAGASFWLVGNQHYVGNGRCTCSICNRWFIWCSFKPSSNHCPLEICLL